MAISARELLSMSVRDLWSLHQQTGGILAAKIMLEMCELESGLALPRRGAVKAASQRPRTRRPYPKVLPKYRNPVAPFETWSGRGRQPRWLVAAVKSGQQIEDFRISQMKGHESVKKIHSLG
jgi:DNA-binding protein H-NS